jgi:uncharacterized protein YegP (UPF0339 family)
MKFVVIKESGNRWIWELRTADGQPMCRSVMSFGSRDSVFQAIQDVRKIAPRALVFDPLGTLYEGV